MCYIQQVTDKEFDWLERCEEQLSGLEASRGRREVIEEEISLLEVGGGGGAKGVTCILNIVFTDTHFFPCPMRCALIQSNIQAKYGHVFNIKE